MVCPWVNTGPRQCVPRLVPEPGQCVSIEAHTRAMCNAPSPFYPPDVPTWLLLPSWSWTLKSPIQTKPFHGSTACSGTHGAAMAGMQTASKWRSTPGTFWRSTSISKAKCRPTLHLLPSLVLVHQVGGVWGTSASPHPGAQRGWRGSSWHPARLQAWSGPLSGEDPSRSSPSIPPFQSSECFQCHELQEDKNASGAGSAAAAPPCGMQDSLAAAALSSDLGPCFCFVSFPAPTWLALGCSQKCRQGLGTFCLSSFLLQRAELSLMDEPEWRRERGGCRAAGDAVAVAAAPSHPAKGV